jgi:starvation-inducible DNA-binding protein
VTTPSQSDRRSGEKTPALDAESLRQNLLMILAHLFDLRLLGSQAHGHFIGTDGVPNVRVQLDGIVQTVCEASDTVAERVRALDAVSHRRSLTALTTTTHVSPPAGERSIGAMLDRVTHRIFTVVDIVRSVHDRVVTTDLLTADLLRVITEVWKGRVGCSILKAQSLSGSASLVLIHTTAVLLGRPVKH